jgi:hypothetical protein
MTNKTASQFKKMGEKVLEKCKGYFAYYHLHVTVIASFEPKCRYTEIILPTKSGYITQKLTTAHFTSIREYNRILQEIPDNVILGFKIEGINCTDLGNLPIWEYKEEHFKGEDIKGLNISEFNISVSKKHFCLMGAKRTIISPLEKKWSGEICILEVWVEKVEKEWLETPYEIQKERADIILKDLLNAEEMEKEKKGIKYISSSCKYYKG